MARLDHFTIGIGCACGGAVLSLVPCSIWPLEILRNAVPYLLAVQLCAIAAAWRRPGCMPDSWRAITISGLIGVSVYHLATFVPLISGVSGAEAVARGDHSLRLYYSNVETGNNSTELITGQIAETDPDVIVLLEVDPGWISRLALRERYPYFREIPREDNFGIALYSRHPFVSPPGAVSDSILPTILAAVSVPGAGPVTIAAVHTLPPMSNRALEIDGALGRDMEEAAAGAAGPFILAGDLNATPFSDLYRSLVRRGGLAHAFWGRGWLRTWNAHVPFLRFFLDHVLYRGPITVRDARVLGAIGSDHYPMVVDFEL